MTNETGALINWDSTHLSQKTKQGRINNLTLHLRTAIEWRETYRQEKKNLALEKQEITLRSDRKAEEEKKRWDGTNWDMLLTRATVGLPAAGRTGSAVVCSGGRLLRPVPQRYSSTKFDKVKSHLAENAAESPGRTEMSFSSASFDFFPQKLKALSCDARWEVCLWSLLLFRSFLLFFLIFLLSIPPYSCLHSLLLSELPTLLSSLPSFFLFLRPTSVFLFPSILLSFIPSRLSFLFLLPSIPSFVPSILHPFLSYFLLLFFVILPSFHPTFHPSLLFLSTSLFTFLPIPPHYLPTTTVITALALSVSLSLSARSPRSEVNHLQTFHRHISDVSVNSPLPVIIQHKHKHT